MKDLPPDKTGLWLNLNTDPMGTSLPEYVPISLPDPTSKGGFRQTMKLHKKLSLPRAFHDAWNSEHAPFGSSQPHIFRANQTRGTRSTPAGALNTTDTIHCWSAPV